MPKLWEETIDRHRHTVRDAIIAAATAMASETGLTSVTMSGVAGRAGVGRATLYKYFPDVESILVAGHERHVERHLAELRELRDQAESPAEALEAATRMYARICYWRARHGDPDLAALVHRGEHTSAAETQLVALFTELLEAVAAEGGLREDLPPADLAAYCLHALTAAARLDSEQAAANLADVVLSGLR